jgi:hypothetical protein
MSNPNEENEDLDITYWQKTYEKQRRVQLKRKQHPNTAPITRVHFSQGNRLVKEETAVEEETADSVDTLRGSLLSP